MSTNSCSICESEAGTKGVECKHLKGLPQYPVEPEYDLKRIETIGINTGYKILTHDSDSPNLELIAVPWTGEAIGCRNILDALCTQMGAKIARRESHMHGRYSFLLHVEGHIKPINLSVIPTLKALPHFPHHFKPNERVHERKG